MSIILFPTWAILISLTAFYLPHWFVDLKPLIVPLLMAVMLSMGLTLKWQDFKQVWTYRWAVAVGVCLQFLVMPLAAWVLSLGFNLSTELMIGMMLVGTTAGGTASNVIAYLAKGDVALSVCMTMVSTLAAVVLLPLLTSVYLNQQVDVPAWSMFSMLVKVILLPVLIGMLINHFLADKIERLKPAFSIFAMLVILLIIAIVVALNSDNLLSISASLVVAVMLHNLIGLGCGYSVTRLLGFDSKISRTVAIEVGMQNSGLSVALALKYFTPISALPGAMFSIWHNLSGAVFASYFSKTNKSTCSSEKHYIISDK